MKKVKLTNEELVSVYTVKIEEAYTFAVSVIDPHALSGDLSGHILAALAMHINNLIRQAEESGVQVKPIMDEVFGKDNTRGQDDPWHYYNQIYWIANMEYDVEWAYDYSRENDYEMQSEFNRAKKSIRHAFNLTVRDSTN